MGSQVLQERALGATPPWDLVSLLARCSRRACLLMHHYYQRRFATPERMALLAQCVAFVETAANRKTAYQSDGQQLIWNLRQSASACLDHDSDLIAAGGEDAEAYSVVECARYAVEAALAASVGDRAVVEKAVLDAFNAAEQAPTTESGQQVMVQGLEEDVECLVS
jgi:hypothetical protein